MKAITVRQPWAWAIIHGGKNIENRTRNIAGSYRGPLAIHAGASDEDLPDIYDRRVAEALRRARTADRPTVGDHIKLGAIIGVVGLVDVHSVNTCIEQQGDGDWLVCSEWAERAGYHLVVTNPRPLAEPIRCPGRLGLWTVPSDIAARIEHDAQHDDCDICYGLEIAARIAREVGSDG